MRNGLVLILFFLTCAFPHVAPAFAIEPAAFLNPDYRGGHDTLPYAAPPEPECTVTATVLRGTASIEKDDVGCGAGRSSSSLSSGDSFGAGASITTGTRSLVELSLPDGSVVRIGPNSTLTVNNAHCEEGDSPFSLRLMLGSMWSKVSPAIGGDTKMLVETENAVTGVRGTTFLVEMFMLDTVYQRRIVDLYPPEYLTAIEDLDTNMTVDVPFQGLVTRVAVFEGSVEVTEYMTDRSVVVDAGEETLAGVMVAPFDTETVRARDGFDGSGEFVE